MSHHQDVLQLADLRSSRGVTLEEIRDSTKIGMNFLRAIEEGAYHKLPGGIYDTSYIRQYAQAAGVDESALLQNYRRYTQAEA
ncbi:MAG: helix-turn-helix domain-containing protein [Bryobacterales bacterium]|nr:helix-turn-helix domain-containing protein [Bryobacterales bacterium]